MANELKIEYLPVGRLKPYEKNAKKHPAEQVEHIANSIREFGFRQPLVVDKNDVLVIGHGRLLAAKKLGLDTVPCVRADDLTEEQKAEIEAIVNSGTRLDIQYYLNTVMDEDKVEDIYLYFKEDAETDSLDAAIDELGSEYSEEEIRLVRIKFISEVAN